jgi:hypothetical protein
MALKIVKISCSSIDGTDVSLEILKLKIDGTTLNKSQLKNKTISTHVINNTIPSLVEHYQDMP